MRFLIQLRGSEKTNLAIIIMIVLIGRDVNGGFSASVNAGTVSARC